MYQQPAYSAPPPRESAPTYAPSYQDGYGPGPNASGGPPSPSYPQQQEQKQQQEDPHSLLHPSHCMFATVIHPAGVGLYKSLNGQVMEEPEVVPKGMTICLVPGVQHVINGDIWLVALFEKKPSSSAQNGNEEEVFPSAHYNRYVPYRAMMAPPNAPAEGRKSRRVSRPTVTYLLTTPTAFFSGDMLVCRYLPEAQRLSEPDDDSYDGSYEESTQGISNSTNRKSSAHPNARSSSRYVANGDVHAKGSPHDSYQGNSKSFRQVSSSSRRSPHASSLNKNNSEPSPSAAYYVIAPLVWIAKGLASAWTLVASLSANEDRQVDANNDNRTDGDEEEEDEFDLYPSNTNQ